MAKAEKSLAELDREIEQVEKALKTAQKKREELRAKKQRYDVFALLGEVMARKGPGVIKQQYQAALDEEKKRLDQAGYQAVMAALEEDFRKRQPKHAEQAPASPVMPSQPAPQAGVPGAPRTPTNP